MKGGEKRKKKTLTGKGDACSKLSGGEKKGNGPGGEKGGGRVSPVTGCSQTEEKERGEGVGGKWGTPSGERGGNGKKGGGETAPKGGESHLC